MGISTSTNFAERAGRTLGRAGHVLARVDAQTQAWLAKHGLGEGLALVAVWLFKIAVLGVLFYAVFWLALLLLLAVAAAWLARGALTEEDVGEWRDGPEGRGYYEHNVRTDYGRLFEDDQ